MRDHWKSLRSGLEYNLRVLKQGTHTWEFYALLILIAVVIVFSASYVVPTFVSEDDSKWAPEKQEIEYIFFFNESSRFEGRAEITCKPIGRYAETGRPWECEYVFLDEVGREKLLFSEETIDNWRGSNFIEYEWTEWELESPPGRIGVTIFYDFYEKRDDNYTISGNFSIPAPRVPGSHYLVFQTGDQLNMRSGTGDVATIYSSSEVANFQYRETIAPIEQLVVFGVLITLLRLCLTLSVRLVDKTNVK